MIYEGGLRHIYIYVYVVGVPTVPTLTPPSLGIKKLQKHLATLG